MGDENDEDDLPTKKRPASAMKRPAAAVDEDEDGNDEKPSVRKKPAALLKKPAAARYEDDEGEDEEDAAEGSKKPGKKAPVAPPSRLEAKTAASAVRKCKQRVDR